MYVIFSVLLMVSRCVAGFEDDTRDYTAVPAVLELMGIQSVMLLTNNPRKLEHLTALGVHVAGRLPVMIRANPFSHGKRVSNLQSSLRLKKSRSLYNHVFY